MTPELLKKLLKQKIASTNMDMVKADVKPFIKDPGQGCNVDVVQDLRTVAAVAEMQDKDLGIGPVKHVELGTINAKMVGEGKTIYSNQCIICHDLDQNKLGPALRNVTKTRSPEYIMNLLLNPAQMQKENAAVKALLKQYNNLPMPDPALNQEKARSVLEYLRSLVK